MEDELESQPRPYDPYLTVRGLLQTHYGLEHGGEIYELLLYTARNAAGDAEPGIIFDDEGGLFAGVERE